MLVAAIVALVVWASLRSAERLENPAVFEVGRIESIVGGGKGVIVKTPDGREVTILGRRSDMAACRKGGAIRLERRGDTYKVAINGCIAARIEQ